MVSLKSSSWLSSTIALPAALENHQWMIIHLLIYLPVQINSQKINHLFDFACFFAQKTIKK